MGEPTTASDAWRSTERRLRKMSQEFPPAACAFRVQARVLCVGTAVVYRVAIAAATSATAQSHHQHQPSCSTCHDWVIAMSQSKLRAFYTQVRAILQQPAVRGRRHSRNDDDRDSDTNWKPFERFLQSIEGVLDQYEHLQTAAFALQARVEELYEGRAALEAFLADCWRALENVSPSLAAESLLQTAALGREVLSVYVLLRELLAFPESILEFNSVYASAVLSLEDVGELLPTAVGERVCSICLERLTGAATRELDPAATEKQEEESDGDDECVAHAESAFSVRLPCAHFFHENCAMAWLRHNPSCPECRASVGKRQCT